MTVDITLIGPAQSEDRRRAVSRADDAESCALAEALEACGWRVKSRPVTHLAQLADPLAPQPDVVVVDARGQTTLPAELPLLTQQHPSTAVLLVASSFDKDLMLEALRARVGECVAEPVSAADLRAAVDRLMGQRQPAASSQVFAFLGAKGGMGTTTLAVNTAAALAGARMGKTLLIDLHLASGDAVLYVGASPKYSVLDALDNIQRLDAAFLRGLVTKASGMFDLLASGNGVLHGPVDTERIRKLIEAASRAYAFVVLDVPPPDTSVFILDAIAPVADVTLVVNQELAAVRSAGRVATAIRERYGQARLNVVINRYDRFADIGIDDVERVTGLKVKELFPNNYRAALESANTGRPLAVERRGKLSAAIASFARGLAQGGGPKPVPQGTSTVFGRWLTPKRKAAAAPANVPAPTTGTVS